MRVGLLFASLLAFGAAATPVNVGAQTQKIPLQIDVTAQDSVGRRLAFSLRDQIGKSGTFYDAGSNMRVGFLVNLVTLNPDDDEPGRRTIYSYVINFKSSDSELEKFLKTYVGLCGQAVLESCARDLMNNLGEQVEIIRQAADK